jgi:transcriptional regulator with XRE-family HTH domain
VKNNNNHLGQKIKRLRAFKGMTQEDLAAALGKTRSLVSYFERTGNINTYTLQEITLILGSNPEEVELKEDKENYNDQPDQNANLPNNGVLQKLLDQQKAEILFLKETIQYQRQLLDELSKGK